MADASPSTRRGGPRRSSRSLSRNPPAPRPRESRSPGHDASRSQRGRRRRRGSSPVGGRDGGGQDRGSRSPSAPGREQRAALGSRASRRRGGQLLLALVLRLALLPLALPPHAPLPLALPPLAPLLFELMRQNDALWHRTTVGSAPPERKGDRVAGAHTAAVADQRAAGQGRRSAPRRRSGTAVGSPERAQRQRQINATRYRDDGPHRTARSEPPWGRRSACSGSRRLTRRGTGTTVGTEPPEQNGDRVVGARAAAAADRRAPVFGQLLAPRR